MIDPRAVIDPSAQLAEDVEVGPYSIIGPDVKIDSGTVVGPHVVIKGPSEIGKNNRFYQFCSIGEDPQDLKYAGEETYLKIGDGNRFREYCTVNRGTVTGQNVTEIGDDNLFMAYVHIAHDCIIGSHAVFSNNASLAGHVTVGDHAILSGFTLVHQFTRIGDHAFTGMGSWLNRDLPPYVIASGNYARAIGINKEGLKRRGYTAETLSALSQAFKALVKGRDREEGLVAVRELMASSDAVRQMVEFIETSERGIVRN